jgi:hypothetical protein
MAANARCSGEVAVNAQFGPLAARRRRVHKAAGARRRVHKSPTDARGRHVGLPVAGTRPREWTAATSNSEAAAPMTL